MKAAFVIWRISQYRFFSSAIEEAFNRGWDVECWHDYGHPQTGLKAYQFPDENHVPVFRNGVPLVRHFQSQDELEQLPEQTKVDVVFSGDGGAKGLSEKISCRYIELQHNAEIFWGKSPTQLLFATGIAMYSPWWLDYATEYYRTAGLLDEPWDAFKRRLEQKTTFVGVPEFDQQNSINPEHVREKYGLPKDKKVVCLLPFPAISSLAFWPRHIFLESSRLKQLMQIAYKRRFEYLRRVFDGVNERAFAKSLRAFCDRNDALLVVKSRKKTPVYSHLAAESDLVLFDRGHYPATLFELLKIADLSMSFQSNAVFASIAFGVPHYSVRIPVDDFFDSDTERDRNSRVRFSNYFNLGPDGPFDFEGVTTATDIPEAIAELPGRKLSSFVLNPERTDQYVAKFVGAIDGQSSARLLDIGAC